MEKTTSPKVLICIVSYNGRKLLEKHLPSVLETSYPNYDVVIIDNGSTDASVSYVKEHHPDIKIIENSSNIGFARANNIAFKEYPDYDFYALLNNDMDVEKDWLDVLVNTAESGKKTGVVGPKIVYAQRKDDRYVINSAGGVVNRRDMSFDRFEGNVDDGSYDRVEEVDFISGGAMLLRANAVQDVGGFDDRMFFYYEDVDLCLRMRDTGWKAVYCGKTRVYHDHMASSRSWGSARRTFQSGVNRIKSIQRRKGIVPSAVELVRSPVEWGVLKVLSIFTDLSYHTWLMDGARREGLKF
jgi:GT2 family glycosyltransferase